MSQLEKVLYTANTNTSRRPQEGIPQSRRTPGGGTPVAEYRKRLQAGKADNERRS